MRETVYAAIQLLIWKTDGLEWNMISVTLVYAARLSLYKHQCLNEVFGSDWIDNGLDVLLVDLKDEG